MGMIIPVPIGRVFVGEEPDDDDVYALAAAGFHSIVCLSHPDLVGERGVPDVERAAADAAGLAFVRLPLPDDGFTAASVRAFRHAIGVLPRPIYVHCGFGHRAAALALIAEGDRLADPGRKIQELQVRGIRLPPRLLAEVARLGAAEALAA